MSHASLPAVRAECAKFASGKRGVGIGARKPRRGKGDHQQKAARWSFVAFGSRAHLPSRIFGVLGDRSASVPQKLMDLPAMGSQRVPSCAAARFFGAGAGKHTSGATLALRSGDPRAGATEVCFVSCFRSGKVGRLKPDCGNELQVLLLRKWPCERSVMEYRTSIHPSIHPSIHSSSSFSS